MTHRAGSTWIAIALALAASALAGCDGCAVDRHAEAQGLDAGVVARAPSALGPATCFVLAQERTRLFDAQIFQLCQGAPSPGPVDCFQAAQSALLFTDPQRIALCRCAGSAEPVACVELLQRETFLTDAEITELCSPTISGGLLANCRPTGGWY
jgi:hypothetical protein